MRKGTILLIFILGINFQCIAQQVSGIVTDSTTGDPLAGVSIFVKGTQQGMATDAEGKYSLQVSSPQDTLVFSFIGFETATVPIRGRTTINVAMVSKVLKGEQLVVIGYEKKKKKNLTEAISTISSKQLKVSPATNVGNMLAGKTSGLIITQRSGYPYSNSPNIHIRGIGSLTKGRSSPLYIVDGVRRNIFHINSYDIKSISVLKDAAATAIYGAAGANGVILVTTKRGHKGPAKFKLNLSAGLQKPVRQPEFIDSYTYANAYNHAQLSDGIAPTDLRFSPEAINAFKTHKYPLIYPDMDWLDYLSHDVAFQTHNSLSVSGGSDLVKYFISAGYQRTNGLFKTFDVKMPDNPNFTKYNLQTNLDLDITPTTRVSLTAHGRVGTHIRLGDVKNEWLRIYQSAPFSGDGLIPAERIPNAPDDYGLVLSTNNSKLDNPYIPGQKTTALKLYYDEGVNIYTRNVYHLNLKVRQNLPFITKGLSVLFKASYDSYYQKGKNIDEGEPEFSPYFKTDVDPNAPGDSSIVWRMFYRAYPLRISESYSKGRSWTMRGKLNYKHSFGRNNVKGMFLFKQRRKFNLNSFPGVPRGLVDMVARLDYNYDERYLLELNMAYQGSEKFKRGRRFGFFPSISGGWIVTNESFMKNVDFLNFLKLYASYGMSGLDRGGGRFLYLPNTYYINGGYGYNFGLHIPQNAHAAAETSIGNPFVTWATSKKQNYAIAMRLLGDRLHMKFAYFHQYRDNIISTLNVIPTYVSAPLPALNYGKVENHGFEANIGWSGHNGSVISYHIKGNVTFARNEVVYKNEVPRQEPYLYRTGHPVGQPFGYVFDRFYKPSDFNADGSLKVKFANPDYVVKPGYLKYKDLNGDGVVNRKDKRAIGYPNYPEYSFGISIGFRYKNISFTTLWQGAAHVSRMFGGAPYRNTFGRSGKGGFGTLKWQVEGAWTREKFENGGKITYPRLTTKANGQRRNMDSDFWLHSSNYIRLKNVKVSYELPASWLANTSLTHVKVYLSGYDLLTFSSLKKYGLDPERSATEGGTVYPITEIYNLGIHVEF